MPVTVNTFESPEQIVVEAIQEWLGDISVANGYYTDLGGRVFFDKPVDRETPLPFVFLTDDGFTFDNGVTSLSLIIVGVAEEQRGDEKKAGRRLSWDIRRCIRGHLKQDPICGFKVAFESAYLEEPEAQSSLIYPTLYCSVTYPDGEIKARY